jgi:hypothetical protein
MMIAFLKFRSGIGAVHIGQLLPFPLALNCIEFVVMKV